MAIYCLPVTPAQEALTNHPLLQYVSASRKEKSVHIISQRTKNFHFMPHYLQDMVLVSNFKFLLRNLPLLAKHFTNLFVTQFHPVTSAFLIPMV